jgi:N-acetyl-gamma-glutamyl-phosphate reductase
MAKTRVGIINVTGYAGAELARLLSGHPGVALVSVSGRSAVGKKLGEVFPHLADIDLTIGSEVKDVAVAFSALPHRESAAEVIPLLNLGVRVVDLSADFRLKDASLYPAWYGFTHPAPDFLQEAVFGLTELYRPAIRKARLVANPGCYPTSAILALAPAIRAGLVGEDIIVDSKSGVSGSGRSLSLATHYAEATDDVAAYALEGHRHLPEITQELAATRPGFEPRVTFVPHLVPMTRGILSTVYAPLKGKIETTEIEQLYLDFYKAEPFVRVTTTPPHTKHTWGSNMCLIYPAVDARTNRLIVISTLDNLVKGAAGQAIQNMNLMLGLPETTGLEMPAVWP